MKPTGSSVSVHFSNLVHAFCDATSHRASPNSTLDTERSALDVRRFQPLLAFGSELILLIADLFHPFDRLSIERFLNGDMRQCGQWRSAVPMLLTGRKPDDIAWPDFLDRTAPT